MAKQVIKWEAADGTQHDTRADAVRHDQLEKLKADLMAFTEKGALDIDAACAFIIDSYAPRPVEPESRVYQHESAGQRYKVSGIMVWMEVSGEWAESMLSRGEADALIESGVWVEVRE